MERHRRAGTLCQVAPEALNTFDCDAMPDYTGNDQRYADQNDELRQNAEFMPLGISFHGATRSERLDTETLAATPNSGAIHAVADQASGRRSAIRRCRGLPLTVGRVAT